MAKATMVVFSSPSAPDRDDEYNAWYDGTHLSDVRSIPGVVGATRFALSEAQMMAADLTVSGHRYMAIYEVDAPDLQHVLDDILAASSDGRFTMSDAIDMTGNPPLTVLYESI